MPLVSLRWRTLNPLPCRPYPNLSPTRMHSPHRRSLCRAFLTLRALSSTTLLSSWSHSQTASLKTSTRPVTVLPSHVLRPPIAPRAPPPPSLQRVQGSALPRSSASGRTYRMLNSAGDTPALQSAASPPGPASPSLTPLPDLQAGVAAASDAAQRQQQQQPPLLLPPPADPELLKQQQQPEDEAALARPSWRAHIARNRSIVADLFQGQQVCGGRGVC